MTIKKDGNFHVIYCDECPEDIETQQANFDAARNMAAKAGWRSFMGPDDKLANACPACVETYRHRQAATRNDRDTEAGGRA